MKINNKIIRLKKITKPKVILLLALTIILSLFIIAVPMAGIAEATNYYVDPTGNDDASYGTSTGTGAFKTIQYAINDSKVVAGDTINVAAGTYVLEPDAVLAVLGESIGIEINKDDLTLRAVGAIEDTIIDFSLCHLGIRIIQVDKVTVEGFTMKGGDTGHHAFQVIGLETNPVSNVNILNNVITGTTDAAISIYGPWGTVTGINVSGNTIDNCKYGIRVGDGVSDVMISNNTITNSTQDTSDWGALTFCKEVSGLTVSGNEISSNEKLNGIVFGYGDGVFTNIVVESNTISNNLGGVLIDGLADITNLVINYNNIRGNTNYGIQNLTTVEVDATYNWWGHASGPSGVGLGSGDAVSDNVDFIPFLGSSSPGGEVVNNVSITKSGPTFANSGDNITYTITYKNIGTDYATNIIITETYPLEVEYVSANPAPDIGNNQWNIVTLAPNEEDTITITVHIK